MSDKIKNSPALMTVLDKINSRLAEVNDRQAAKDFDTDTKLAWLGGRVGDVAHAMQRQNAVLNVAVLTVAWLEALHLGPTDIIAQIAEERSRQRQLFADRKHSFRVDSTLVGWPRKFRVLLEEVGEVAEAIDLLEASPRCKKFKRHFIDELVQVAAVCCAWLESYEAH